MKAQRGISRRLDEPQGQSGRVWKILPPSVFYPRTVQSVASRYTDCAIPTRTQDQQSKYKNFSHSQTSRCLQTLSWFSKGNGDVIDPVALIFGIGLVIPTNTDGRHEPLLQNTQHTHFYQNTHWMTMVWEIQFHACYAVAAILNKC
jgi:hypothetical protein